MSELQNNQTREGSPELGPSDAIDPIEGREYEGPSAQDAQGRLSEGAQPGSAETVRDHQREGSGPRVSRPEDIDRLEEDLETAFRSGDPQKAWSIAQTLLSLAKAAVLESAKARFSNNFGKSVCESCEGLKIRPGVTATCYQVRQCYYDNFRAEVLSPKQARILNLLR